MQTDNNILIAKFLGLDVKLNVAIASKEEETKFNTIDDYIKDAKRNTVTDMPRYEWYRLLFKGKYYQLYTGMHDSVLEIDKADIEHTVVRDGKYYKIEDLLFRSSWDWLMPVIEKIQALGYGTSIVGGVKGFATVIHIPEDLLTSIGIGHEHKGIENSLQATYKAVVQFIEWFNKQSQ